MSVVPRTSAESKSDTLPHWYAVYTCPHHEKRVAEQLAERRVEYFFPSYEVVRRWKDRRVKIRLPLFPSYVFVRLPLKERLQVLGLPSVVRFVAFHGRPAPLPDAEIEVLRKTLAERLDVQPHAFLKIGRRVRITHGPLQGAEGILVQRKNNLRLVLSIELIRHSVSVEVHATDLEAVPDAVARVARRSAVSKS